jgi:hypothetical protein
MTNKHVWLVTGLTEENDRETVGVFLSTTLAKRAVDKVRGRYVMTEVEELTVNETADETRQRRLAFREEL